MQDFNKHILYLLLLLVPTFAFSQDYFTTYNNEKGVALGIKASSLGVGFEVITAFNKSLALRGGFSYFPYEYKPDIKSGDGTTRNSKAKVGSLSVGFDWNFISFMHLSVGALYNYTSIDFDVYATNPDTENNGHVAYNLEPNKVCPYFSIGFGRSISKQKIVSVGLDIGAVYQGTTSVTYQVTPTISPEKLSKWTYNITSGSKLYTVYPLVSLMVAFRIS